VSIRVRPSSASRDRVGEPRGGSAGDGDERLQMRVVVNRRAKQAEQHSQHEDSGDDMAIAAPYPKHRSAEGDKNEHAGERGQTSKKQQATHQRRASR